MKTNISEFREKLKKQAVKAVADYVKDTQLAIGQYVFEKVITRTPVLTGHARHNWQSAVNKDPDWEREGVFGGTVTGEPITQNERAMWADTRRNLRRQPLGQTIHISNNVPYARRLEDGYSQKSPAGMVEITLLEVVEGVFKNQPKVMSAESGE